MRRAAAADIAAFEQLYRRHHARMQGDRARLVGQAGARAEDLVQGSLRAGRQALPAFRFERGV